MDIENVHRVHGNLWHGRLVESDPFVPICNVFTMNGRCATSCVDREGICAAPDLIHFSKCELSPDPRKVRPKGLPEIAALLPTTTEPFQRVSMNGVRAGFVFPEAPPHCIFDMPGSWQNGI